MSRLDELIADLCPQGVTFHPMWTLTTWDKKFNAVDRRKQPEVKKYRYLLANEMTPLIIDGGDVKLLTTNLSDFWTTEEIVDYPVHEGNVVAIPWGGNAIVQHCNGKFVTSDNRIAVARDSNEIDMKFLYYFIQNNLLVLSSFYRGSGIKHPSMAKVLDWRIPVPPLDVQREIVRILDQFVQLEAELRAELEVRKLQYAYCSESALTVDDDSRAVSLGDAVSRIIDHRGKTPTKLGGDWSNEGHRVISALNMKNGVVDDNDHHYIEDEIYARWMRQPLEVGDVLLTSEAPLGAVAYVDREVDWAIGQRIFALRPRRGLLDGRYLYHILRAGAVRKELMSRSTGSTVSGIRQAELVKLSLRLPSVPRQERIAEALDYFEQLTNGVTGGLPAELKARRKQYEYYRNKLLTFEELPA